MTGLKQGNTDINLEKYNLLEDETTLAFRISVFSLTHGSAMFPHASSPPAPVAGQGVLVLVDSRMTTSQPNKKTQMHMMVHNHGGHEMVDYKH